MIDIAVTAMPRPELHEQLFQSFTQNFQGIDWSKSRINMNIDPYPCRTDDELDQMLCKRAGSVQLAEKYFGTVNVRLPMQASHAAAVKWVWNECRTPYILHLEDDFTLDKPVDGPKVLAIFDKLHTLIQIVLRYLDAHWIHKYPYIQLTPSLLARKFYLPISQALRSDQNPEMQLRTRTDFPVYVPNCLTCHKNGMWRHSLIYPHYTEETLVHHHGITWMADTPFKNPHTLCPDHPNYKPDLEANGWVLK